MKVIGVTGNSGSGKSTVSTIIKNNLNCTVISADNLAKKINVPGSEYYEKTIELFGKDILNEDGTINRRKLAPILFTDVETKRKMNLLTSKYVGGEIEKLVNEEKAKANNGFVVIDAPLLFECGVDKLCDYVIAVTCAEEDTKISRICIRDKITKNQAKIRLEAQPDDEFYTSKADYVIYNNQDTLYITLIKGVIKVIHDIKDKVKNEK